MQANFNATFLKTFNGYEEYYVLIGGTATSIIIILDAHGLRGRATKDYDMVIIDEKKNEGFYHVF